MGIKFEICPEKCIGVNLHSHGILDTGVWRDISNRVRQTQNYTCQCCGVRPHKGPAAAMSEMAAHEVWLFDKENHVQRLTGIVCVCQRCHKTIHYRNLLKSQHIDSREAVISKGHYMEVNWCSEMQFEKDLNEALAENALLDKETQNWKLDISFAIQQGYFSFRDVHLDRLEAAAPDSLQLLEPYRRKPLLALNPIPEECLIDYADKKYFVKEAVPCEICGELTDTVFDYYDLQANPSTFEMSLAWIWKICPMCRETIYFGAGKLFKKYRKTTKHYMKVNGCSFQCFKLHARAAVDAAWKFKGRSIDGNRLHIFLRIPYTKSYDDFKSNRKYLISHGAKYDAIRCQFCLSPVERLRDFLPYI